MAKKGHESMMRAESKRFSRNFLIGVLFLVAAMFAVSTPQQAQAASSKTMIKAYNQFLAEHKSTMKLYNIVYIGGGPALVTKLWWYDFSTNRNYYTMHNTYADDVNGGGGRGYGGCSVYYYVNGKVKYLGEAFAVGGYKLVYWKNFGLVAKGDTLGTATPWRYYIKNGKLYNRLTAKSRYDWNRLLKAKVNNKTATSVSKYPFSYFKLGGRNITSLFNSTIKETPPAYFFDGVMGIYVGKSLKYGVRISWKLNPGWHASVYYGWETPIRNTSILSRRVYSDGVQVKIWKGTHGKAGYREEYFSLMREDY